MKNYIQNNQILGFCAIVSVMIFFAPSIGQGQELYDLPKKDVKTRWFSFENLQGLKGKGGMENKGAKGHPADAIKAGETQVILETEGAGVVRRMWMTISDRSPEMLRSLKLEMYWDGKEKPAVSVPLGDFFGAMLGEKVPMENAFFSDPEGRSFNCIIPMPFKKGAKISITNESDTDLEALFYDINITTSDADLGDVGYFHAFWHRDTATTLGEDHVILPKLEGNGRFLGVGFGLNTHPDYGKTWWGEGEVKIYLDGDSQFPTLVGSGTEDYIGTAYGQGKFVNHYQGAPINDVEEGRYAFYRFHVPDPVYFHQDIKVTIQQMGGAPREKVKAMLVDGAKLVPVTVSWPEGFLKLLEEEGASFENAPKGWTNFYRSDDLTTLAYFYYDKPSNDLGPLASLEIRQHK
ncbi:glycoside hydrolase family 172 protein [Echinicola rosea]|nr:glycoside hydrolase family 172 protein [Echinicola rosea]